MGEGPGTLERSLAEAALSRIDVVQISATHTGKLHPDAWRTGRALRDEVAWLFRTQVGRAKAFKIIEAALAQRTGGGASRCRPTP